MGEDETGARFASKANVGGSIPPAHAISFACSLASRHIIIDTPPIHCRYGTARRANFLASMV